MTPCALSSIPLVIGYVGGTSGNEPKKAFRLSLTFDLGMAVTFTALGTAASLLGKLMGTSGRWWYFVLGVLMVLVVLLGLVARSGNATWGILLLLCYSIGHSVLVLAAGTSIGFVRKITASPRYDRFSAAMKIIMGTAILAIALYMFYLSF